MENWGQPTLSIMVCLPLFPLTNPLAVGLVVAEIDIAGTTAI
jgi:hypothetical protein